jgi:hypothetical protein
LIEKIGASVDDVSQNSMQILVDGLSADRSGSVIGRSRQSGLTKHQQADD